MAQFGRPESDKLVQGWTTAGNSANNLWEEINEVSFNDVDYIRSPQSPANNVYVCKFSNMVDPSSNASHTMRWRAGKDVDAGSETIDMIAGLYINYNNEVSKGTEIFSQNNNNLAYGFTNFSHALSAVEADAITDYNNCFGRFLMNKV